VQLATKAGINVAILANVECGRRRLSLDLAKILYGAIAEIERERTHTIKSLEAVLDDPNSGGGATVKAADELSEEESIKRTRLWRQWFFEMSDEERSLRRQRVADLKRRAEALLAEMEKYEAEDRRIK
jgi:transcriptional regulator with XRE-family HTH domain